MRGIPTGFGTNAAGKENVKNSQFHHVRQWFSNPRSELKNSEYGQENGDQRMRNESCTLRTRENSVGIAPNYDAFTSRARRL
jgi:hypothetical protein